MRRQLSSHPTQVAAVGVGVTLLVLALAWLGLFEHAARWSIDQRYKHARLERVAMSDRIRHVDVDDGSIESIGRWPWPRSRLADAIAEIARSGAAVVALDLTLNNPEQPTWEAPTGVATTRASAAELELISHDESLAASLRMMPSVLALKLAAEDAIGEEWQSAQGRAELERLIDLLCEDVRADEHEVAAKAVLTGDRRGRFLNAPRLFRLVAGQRIARRLLEEKGDEATFEDLVRRAAPSLPENIGEFAERPMLVRAWDQMRAWRILDPLLREGDAPDIFINDRAPTLVLARSAGAVGVVNTDLLAEPDGAVRTIEVLYETPGGPAVQFGLMAAAALQGLTARDIVFDGDRVTIGDVMLPAPGGLMLLDWPDPSQGYEGALRQDEDDKLNRGHTPIGVLVSLAAQRRVQSRNEELLEAVTREVASLALNVDARAPITDEIREGVREVVSLTMDDVRAAEAEHPLTEEEQDEVAPFRQHELLEEAVRSGREEIDAASDRLRRELEGRLVFVGWTSTGALADFFKTTMGARTPGVVVHAVAADMALTGRGAHPAPPWVRPALVLLMGLAATAIASRLSPIPSTIAAISLAGAFTIVAGVVLFNWTPDGRGVVLPLISPLVAGAAAWTAATSLEAALLRRDRQRITRQFKARVSSQLVEKLVENPGAVSMAGEQREMTTMFVDLAGFTSISEKLDGPTTVSTLNRAMRGMTTVLTAERAYVNKFLGDGLMAFWSAFEPDPEQAARACRAAIACQKAIVDLQEDESFAGLPRLSARVGIATGPVVVGDCGAPPDLNDYTVIGNAVNLAARLESANKQFGTKVLIDGRTRELLGQSAENGDIDRSLGLRRLGRITVVGQTVPVEIFEVLGPDADTFLIELTEEAVDAFAAGDFIQCLAAIKRLEDKYGHSKLGDAYREGVADGAEGIFDGVLRLRAK